MVYPDEFIPLFEQNGFIRELDLFVLDTVCAWIRRRLDEGKKVPPISINQSKALFFHDNYVETVLTIAARHDVPTHLLHVEVTESMAWLDEEAFIRTLDALRRAGIGLSLDDFGKGYSSMAMLHSFGFDTIKLDRAFLAPGQDKQRSVWIIISSLVDMARRLGIEILCEGVETEEQLQKLLASHCKYGQGYLFSPPMNMETFDAYVDAHDLEQKYRTDPGAPFPGGEGRLPILSPQMQSAVFPSGKTALLSWQGSLPHEKGGLAAPSGIRMTAGRACVCRISLRSRPGRSIPPAWDRRIRRRRPIPLRCAAAGCTWPYDPNAMPNRS